MKVWILTTEYNAYDQYGEYFVDVFQNKPTLFRIMEDLQCSEEEALHILNGGGRKNYEEQWFYLHEMECN